MRTAFFIDGAFFLRRYRLLQGKRRPSEVASALHEMCRRHLEEKTGGSRRERERHRLQRIFYYDCPPLSKKAHNPVTHKAVDFATTRAAEWRLSFLEELKKLRKVALRLGYLDDRWGHWALRRDHDRDVLKELLSGRLSLGDLTEADVTYAIRQKGVDMRLGLDIASVAYKRQVDQIVLVSGDSDFVPAAKLALREGIDFILDPMWAPVRADLREHIDGLRSVFARPQPQKPKALAAASQSHMPIDTP